MKRSTFLLVVLTLIAAAPFAWADSKSHPVVVMKTSEGTIEITLDAEKAPVTTANFLSYVDKKFYDGTVFHRVVRGLRRAGRAA